MANKELIEFILNEMQNKNLDKEKGKGFLQDILSEDEKKQEIAIIGVSCRFPDADSIDEFWENLIEEKDSIGSYPENRIDDLLRISDGPTNAMKGGFLKRVDLFDPEYFDMPPKACIEMDPYHRIMLEVFVEALENAGYYIEQIKGKKVGVYVGNDMTHRMVRSYFPFLSDVSFSALVGSWTSVLASRISYLFNLRGPAMVLDTGCSSALTALDAAVKAIRNNDCETAFVGGINLLLDPSALAEQTLSEDYVVRSFDDSANGTVWSEGAGGIYIKPLDKAVKDGDHIYGVIKGIAVNCDGNSNGITAPNAKAQAEVISEAWKRAKINPEDISYIEAHGTGTVLGDPIEVKGLLQAYKAFNVNKKQTCGLGTVKSNIGHTVGAAGMASLVKVLLSFKHNEIPASINFKSPNQFIDFCSTPLYMQSERSEWKSGGSERIAGINGFSLGGTNVHVVLQSYPDSISNEEGNRFPFYISNKRNTLVLKDLYNLRKHFKISEGENYADICYTLAAGRKNREFGVGFFCGSKKELTDKLEAAIEILEGGAEHYEENGIYIGSTEDDFREDKQDKEKQIITSYINHKNDELKELLLSSEKKHVNLPAASFDNRRMWDQNAVKKTAVAEESREDVLRRDVRKILEGESQYLSDNTDERDVVAEITAYIWRSTLGYDQISLDSDFYQLGGDSITALTVVRLINGIFETDVHESLVLEKPLFSDFVASLKNDYQLSEDRIGSREESHEVKEITDSTELKLTSSQKSIFYSVYGKDPSVAYNISAIARNKGKIDKKKLEKVFSELVSRHESIRATFTMKDDEPIQIIHPSSDAEIEYYQLKEKSGKCEEELLEEELGKIIRPFDIETGPLFRISYVEGLNDASYLVFDIHHIISDGYSMGVLYKDFIDLMTDHKIEEPEVRYSEAVTELCNSEQREDIKKQKEWWEQKYAEPVPEMDIFTTKRRRPAENRKGKLISSFIDGDLYHQLKNCAKEYKTTNFVMLLSLLHTLLSLCSNENDIVIGTPVSGRNFRGGNDLVGMFVNTIPIRLNRSGTDSFADYIKNVKKEVLDSFKNQDYPYERLISETKLPVNTGRNPLFDVYFAMHNIDMGLDESVSFVDYHNGSAKFDLTVTAREKADGLLMTWEYDTALYEKGTVEKIADRFKKLSELICEEHRDSVAASDLMLEGEKDLLIDSIGMIKPYKTEKRDICTLFEENVEKYPDKLFLINDDGRYSFAEANNKANYIAKELMLLGVKKGDPVALLTDHSCDMVIAILAIMKCGGYYVPLYTKLPQDRLETMLTDSEAKIIVTQEQYETCIREAVGNNVKQYFIPGDDKVVHTENVEHDLTSDDRAYMMYTSGTTSKPKGIIIHHKGVLRVVKDNGYLDFHDDDVVMTISNYSFDGSVFDIFAAVINGLTLVIPSDEDVTDIPRLSQIIQKYDVKVFFITTALFNALVDTSLEALKNVRKIIFGGENASGVHIERALNALGNDRLIHAYGPTESCVFATTYPITGSVEGIKIPIGRAIRNTQLFVLDDDRNLLPTGIIGELYIGGDGLGEGYYKQEEKTKASFIKSDMAIGGYLYKTGDYAAWGEDRQLYFYGRRDKQVKLRGFRIECDEISNIAMSLPSVKIAYSDVSVSETGSKTLCMWLVKEGDREYKEEELRLLLHSKLPQYMIPAFIIPVDNLPTNKNGKVDMARLPKPSEVHVKDSFKEAETAMEKLLADVWKSVLDNGEISVEDDFFQLGGDSIKGIQIISRLKEYGLKISLKDIFTYQSIRNLAAHVEKASNRSQKRDPEDFSDKQMSAVQHMFLSDVGNKELRFTQALKIKIPEKLSLEQIESSWSKICECHPMLRMQVDEDSSISISKDRSRLPYKIIMNSGSDIDDKAFIEAESVIDLEKGPISVVMVTDIEDGTLLNMAIHHMAVDVVSWGIIIEDFIRSLKDNTKLIEEATSFAEWSGYAREYYRSENRAGELDYWKDVARQSKQICRLFPSMIGGSAVKNQRRVCKSLENDAVRMLMNEVRSEYGVSMQVIVMCILALALSKWKMKDAVLLNVERHGRYDFDGEFDLSRTVGWFTEYCPVILANCESITDIIQSLTKFEKEIPNDGIGYGIMKYLVDNLSDHEKEIFEDIHPEINFNFLGKQESSSGTIEYFNNDVTVDKRYKSEWALDIVADYSDDGIRFDMAYCKNAVTEDEMSELMTCIEKSVDAIAEDYQRKGDITSVVTKSTSSISETEFENILDELMI